MKRVFKYYVVTSGTTRPLVGTTLSAAVTANATAQSVAVADSSMFSVGDFAIIGTQLNRSRITAIADGTHITVIITDDQASGVTVRMWAPCASVYVQTKDGNTGNIWIGSSSTITPSTGAGGFVELTPVASGVQPVDVADANIMGNNPLNIANYWATGTVTNDSYLPSFEVT